MTEAKSIMAGKRGLIMGVANDRSLAWGIARSAAEHGAELADELETLVEEHGAHTIAAVIVEPLSGSAGVILPPKGYLERLREICTKNDILLIFDEVITGFGRLGAPFAYQRMNIQPDLLTVAKGMTNATVPMGGVFATAAVREAFLAGPETMPDLFHGYTYSGHPLACAAAIATLGAYREGDIFGNALRMEPIWEDMLHGLRDLPGVVDIRNFGLVGAIQISERDAPGVAGRAVFEAAWDQGLILRPVGDSLAMSPPLTIDAATIDEIGQTLRRVLS